MPRQHTPALIKTTKEMTSKAKRLATCALCALMAATGTMAQNDSILFEDNTRIDTTVVKELRLNINSLSYFRDNEYKGNLRKGYTLPGFWLQPTISFQPIKNLRLEAGVYMQHYWGANKYPNMNYHDIGTWKGDQTQSGFHVLPFFQVQLAATRNTNIILGNIYGRCNHRLAEPLYNPEAAMSADPEAGVQILWRPKFMDFDTWVNWESFIFDNDKHQEAFTVGVSARLKANGQHHGAHIYFPIQLLMQHRGGEINTEAQQRQIKTWMNAAAGIGATVNTGNPVLPRLNAEIMGMYYSQVAGNMLPFDNGHALYAKAEADIWRFRLMASYWDAHHFVTIFGNPLYGCMGIDDESYTMPHNRTASMRLSYSRDLGHGFCWGAYADIIDNLPANAHSTSKGSYRESNSMSMSAGIYLRINPSYLLKRL